jgi:hypothetical protein
MLSLWRAQDLANQRRIFDSQQVPHAMLFITNSAKIYHSESSILAGKQR